MIDPVAKLISFPVLVSGFTFALYNLKMTSVLNFGVFDASQNFAELEGHEWILDNEQYTIRKKGDKKRTYWVNVLYGYIRVLEKATRQVFEEF